MATFGQMKQWVSKRLQDPNNTAVSSDDVGGLINEALNQYMNERFWFNEKTDNPNGIPVFMTQGNATIPLPDNFLCPSLDDGAFVVQYSGIRYPLQKWSEPFYNLAYLSNGIGQPFWYSRQADLEYQVFPIPDRDYQILRFWLADYDDFVNDGDTNDFSDNAYNLLQYYAAAIGSRDFRQDIDMYNAFMAQADTEEKNLLWTTRKDNATGSVTLYSTLG